MGRVRANAPTIFAVFYQVQVLLPTLCLKSHVDWFASVSIQVPSRHVSRSRDSSPPLNCFGQRRKARKSVTLKPKQVSTWGQWLSPLRLMALVFRQNSPLLVVVIVSESRDDHNGSSIGQPE